LWFGRGARGVVVPITIVFLSIIWTMGAIGWIGFTLNTMVIILPPLLICVGIGDSIHFISEYRDHIDQGMARKKAMLKTFSMIGLPCLLTTMTTMGAFLSFLTVSIRPFREFGIYAAIGVVAALILTYVLVPFFYSFGMKKNNKPVSIKASDEKNKRHDFFDRMLGSIHKIVTRRPGLVVGFFIILSLISIVGTLKIQLESSMVELVSTKVPIRRAYDFIDARMGGSMSMEIMFDTKKPDGIKNQDFLKKMDNLQTYLDKHPMVTKTSSVLDVIKKMRRALHNNNPEFYSIADTSKAASQYLFLYETSGGDQLDKQVSFDYDIARLTVKMPLADTDEITRFIEDVEAFSRKIFDDSVNVEITGSMALTKAMNDRMGEGIKSSFLAVLIAITIMMIFFLRSVKLGLISMIPNVFPVLITLGFMGFRGILMSMPLMCCSAIIIGVAVDDTIHFFRRYRREFTTSGNYSAALQATLATVGRPITFTTLTLILGFMVMILSVMKGWSHFGFLAGFAFFWALMADFFFAPALMLLTKPLGPEAVK
jgi:predicted RND superfamily exporter protein